MLATTMVNEGTCINPCTRKLRGWEQGHKPPYLKGVYSTIASSTTIHPPCLSAKVFSVNHLPSKVTQDTKVRECEVMYTLTLKLTSTRLSDNTHGLMFQEISFTVAITRQPQQPKGQDHITWVSDSIYVPFSKQGLFVPPHFMSTSTNTPLIQTASGT